MGHNSAISGHPISTSFSQVDGWSKDPRVLEPYKACFVDFPILQRSTHVFLVGFQALQRNTHICLVGFQAG